MCLIDPDIRSWNIPLPEHVFLPRGVESTKFGEFSIIVHLFFFFFFLRGVGGGGAQLKMEVEGESSRAVHNKDNWKHV